MLLLESTNGVIINTENWMFVIAIVTVITPYFVLVISNINNRKKTHEKKQDIENDSLKLEMKELNSNIADVKTLFSTQLSTQQTTCDLTRKTVFQNVKKLDDEVIFLRSEVSNIKEELVIYREQTNQLIKKYEKTKAHKQS